MNTLMTLDDGSLYDYTRSRVIRPLYARHERRIETGQQLRASLRAGPYAWPGGYSVIYVTSDGNLLCHRCVTKELRATLYSIRDDIDDAWRIVGTMLDNEIDDPCNCDNCDGTIVSEDE